MGRTMTILGFAALLQASLWAQEVRLDGYRIDSAGQVSFTCTVSKHHSDREQYRLAVYTNKDLFKAPLPLELPFLGAGRPERIVFDGGSMVGDYDGYLTLDVRAEAVVFPVEVSAPVKAKRGKEIELSWSDFHGTGSYDVALYQSGGAQVPLAKGHAGNYLAAKLPKTTAKGSYELRVTPVGNPVAASHGDGVKVVSRKGGLLALPALLAAGAVYLTAGGGSPGDEEDLPGPPGTP